MSENYDSLDNFKVLNLNYELTIFFFCFLYHKKYFN